MPIPMTSHRHRALALALALSLGSGAAMAASDTRLAGPTGDDLGPAAALTAVAPPPPAGIERAPVSFAWRLDPAATLERPQPFVHESREFHASVKGESLARGFRVHTTAPGAVIRISPDGPGAAGLAVQGLRVTANGVGGQGLQGVEAAADAAQMAQAGAAFAPGTVAFRVRPELGAGDVVLQAAGASGRYLVHVYEPESPVQLALAADAQGGRAGGRMRVHAHFAEAGQGLDGAAIGGLLVAPDGRVQPVGFRMGADGRAEAVLDLPAEASATPGLWEVHAFASDAATGALRDAKTAIEVVAPTARFTGEARGEASNGVRATLGVEAAAAGRYELRGVLYATRADGVQRPVAIAHAAQWLEPGQAGITLAFGPELLPTGFGAPYALRELSLADQSRRGTLETRAHAMVIEASPVATPTPGPAPRPGPRPRLPRTGPIER